jgi:hypothetical protein
MSWSQWETEVLHILNNPDDDNTRMVATATAAYTEELKAGNVSQAEYAELLRDLQRQIIIVENMSQFETKQRLNTAITALVIHVDLRGRLCAISNIMEPGSGHWWRQGRKPMDAHNLTRCGTFSSGHGCHIRYRRIRSNTRKTWWCQQWWYRTTHTSSCFW